MNYDLHHMHLQLSKEWKSSWDLTDLCCIRLSKCGLFSNKHSGIASIKITDQLFCNHQLLEKKSKYSEAVHQLFIYFRKEYDSVTSSCYAHKSKSNPITGLDRP